MSRDEPGKEGLKEKIAHETREYVLIAAYLACFFVALTIYRKLILAEYQIGYFEYGWALLQALILSKVILIGQALHIGERFQDRPLIVSTLWKTVVFAAFAAGLILLEHVVKALLHHEPLSAVFRLTGARRDETIARLQLVLVAFVPFFAFQEADRALPEARLFDLFFRGRRGGGAGDRG